jgi:hypothetical protein
MLVNKVRKEINPMMTMTELTAMPTTATTNPVVTLYLPLSTTHDLSKMQLKFKGLLKEAAQTFASDWPDQDWTAYAAQFADAFSPSRRITAEPAASVCLVSDGQQLQVFALELTVPASVSVGEQANILPLLLDRQQQHSFDLLTLQQDQIGLYRYDRHELSTVHLPADAPRTLKETLGSEIRGGSLNSVSQGPGKVSYHGHSDKAAEDAIDTQRFFQAVDSYIATHYSNPGGRPLVLMGLAPTLGTFRQLSRNPMLDDDQIVLSPSGLSRGDLRTAAVELCQRVDLRNDQQALANLDAARSSSRATSELGAIADLLPGGIEQLVIAENANIPGRLHDGVIDTSSPAARRQNLVNAIASQVLTDGGQVHILSSEDAPAVMTAVSRYPLH